MMEALGPDRSDEFSGEGFLEDGLAKAAGALEVGGDCRFEFFNHAQSSFDFSNDPDLFGQWG